MAVAEQVPGGHFIVVTAAADPRAVPERQGATTTSSH